MTQPASPGRRACYYLVATTGHPNYGDELICAQWLRYLSRTAPDADVWVDCHSPGLSQLLLGGLHPRVRFVDTLWRMCWAAPDEDPYLASAFVTQAVARAGVVPAMDPGRLLLLRADVLHVLGGGYVTSAWPRHYGLVAGIIQAARTSGARTGITGQGLLPIASGVEHLVREQAAELDVCDVRDQPGQQLLAGVRRTRLSRTADDVFLGLGRELYDERPSPDVMVCAQSDLLDRPLDELAGLVERVLGDWQVSPDQVGWVEAMPVVDKRVYDLVARSRPGMRFYPFTEVWQHGLPARAGQRWVSTRFHPHLVAAAAGCWGVRLSVDRTGYYDVKHEALLQQGSGWGSLSLDTFASDPEVPVPGEGAVGFGHRADELAGDKRIVAEALYGPPGP